MSEGVVFTFMCGRFMIKRNSQPRVSVNGQSRLEIFAFLRTERLLPHHPPLFFSWTGEGGGDSLLTIVLYCLFGVRRSRGTSTTPCWEYKVERQSRISTARRRKKTLTRPSQSVGLVMVCVCGDFWFFFGNVLFGLKLCLCTFPGYNIILIHHFCVEHDFKSLKILTTGEVYM